MPLVPTLTAANVSSPYGWRTHPVTGEQKLHAGADFRLTQGSPVSTIAWGQVVEVKPVSSDLGLTAVVGILHPYGWKSRYVHLSRVDVKKGQWVAPGQVIGLSGGAPGVPGSGPSTTGAHLHLELYYFDPVTKLWTKTDPIPWIFKKGARK